ncbi:MAG: TolC family protein [Pirellulaceae bacterium]
MINRSPTIVVSIALALASLSVIPQGAARGREVEDDSIEMAAAVQQLRETARKLVDLQAQAYRSGEAGFEQLLHAQRQLLEVELELAKTNADRVEILSKQLELAKKAEELATARFKNGDAPSSEILQARIARLRIEVALLKERE